MLRHALARVSTASAPVRHAPRAFSTSGTKKVGFIGLGNMGLPMCMNLTNKSEGKFDVTCFDKFDAANERAEKEGMKVAKHGLEEIAKESDIIVSMLFNTQTSFEVGSRCVVW